LTLGPQRCIYKTMFNLYLNRNETDHLTGETIERDPLFLELGYPSMTQALDAAHKLEAVYGAGRIEIDQAQSYESRMGRF
jgi:hypothetical protein